MEKNEAVYSSLRAKVQCRFCGAAAASPPLSPDVSIVRFVVSLLVQIDNASRETGTTRQLTKRMATWD